MADPTMPADGGDLRTAVRAVLLGGWAIAVVGLTLGAVDIAGTETPIPTLCLLCGDRGLADAVLNVILFLPLGVGVAGARRSRWLAAAAIGLGISLSIEICQALIPGRHPTAGDVLWNAVGAGLGAVISSWLSLRSSSGQVADLGIRAALAAGMIVIASGVLLSPAPTQSDYWGQWTPDLGTMPQYEGVVREAFLGDRPLPPGLLDGNPPARLRLEGAWRIRSTILAGPPPSSLSPIISVYDRDEREILLLGADGIDAVLRERTLAKSIRLDQPDLRVTGIFGGVVAGQTVALGARRNGERRCVQVGQTERCGLGFTPGRGWGLLYFPSGISDGSRRSMDLAWIALLFLPVGLLSTSVRSGAGSGAVAAFITFGAAVVTTRLVPAPLPEYGAAALGLFSGLLVARLAHRSHQKMY